MPSEARDLKIVATFVDPSIRFPPTQTTTPQIRCLTTAGLDPVASRSKTSLRRSR